MILKGFGSGREHGRKDFSEKIRGAGVVQQVDLRRGESNICHCQGNLEEASETFCFPVPKHSRFSRKKNTGLTYLKVLPRVS